MQISLPPSHGSEIFRVESNANTKFSNDPARITRQQLLLTFLPEPCRSLSPSCSHFTLKSQHPLQPSSLPQSNKISWIHASNLIPGSRFAPSLTPLQCGNSSNSFNAKIDNRSRSLIPGWRIAQSLMPLQCGNSSYSFNAKIDTSSGNLIPGSRIAQSLMPLQCGNSSNSFDAKTDNDRGSLRRWIELVGEFISTAFPIWVALGCLLGLLKPSSFNWVKPKWPVLFLSTTMLGMGMTLTLDDLNDAVSMPKEVLSGFFLQYSVMPISGFLVSKLLNLPSHYAAGLILVGCCPGGTASNIVTYIARGNVALSVVMTAASTFTAVVMTPFLTAKLAGQYVAVDANSLLTSTLQVVLLPVLTGAFLNQYFHGLIKFVSPLMPLIAVASVTVLCGNAIAQNASAILSSGLQVVLAVCLLHASGFFFGYVLSRMLRLDVVSSRTISIEVGMQNSVLGVVLATQHFGNPLTAVPCAVSSVCHSIFGSILAGIWRRSMPTKKQD